MKRGRHDLRRLLKDAHLSVSKAAEMIRMSRETLNRKLCGHVEFTFPEEYTLKDLCNQRIEAFRHAERIASEPLPA